MRKIQVPYIDQSIKYPTGCESVSAVMLLKYLGYEITVDEFIQNCLECREMEIRDGVLYGPDPNKFFCGNPYDEESYGIYARGLQKALAKAAGDHYEFLDETGTSTETLLKKYIDQDMPWYSGHVSTCVRKFRDRSGNFWIQENDFCWTSNEHCMLLVGYDEEKYYFNDPYDNNGVVGYPRTLVEKRHAAQHSMALGVLKR